MTSAIYKAPCLEKDSELGLMLCYCNLEIFNNFCARDTTFSFFTGPHELWIWSWSKEVTRPVQTLEKRRWDRICFLLGREHVCSWQGRIDRELLWRLPTTNEETGVEREEATFTKSHGWLSMSQIQLWYLLGTHLVLSPDHTGNTAITCWSSHSCTVTEEDHYQESWFEHSVFPFNNLALHLITLGWNLLANSDPADSNA